jgi:hypothetical protein
VHLGITTSPKYQIKGVPRRGRVEFQAIVEIFHGPSYSIGRCGLSLLFRVVVRPLGLVIRFYVDRLGPWWTGFSWGTPPFIEASVTPTFYKNTFFCANRSAYKNAYQIVVHMKNFPKINLV